MSVAAVRTAIQRQARLEVATFFRRLRSQAKTGCQREEKVIKIGIIGAGNIGSVLTRRFTALGHDVDVANSRGPASLAELASATHARAASVNEAARGKDIVVVTIPEKNIRALPHNLFEGVGETVVVDTGNYYPRQRDGRIDAIETGTTESRWVARKLRRPVVKAFNNIMARHLLELGRPRGTPGRIALPVAGDEPAAKDVVMRLVEELGFDAVDAGGLDDSWRQQPGSPAYGSDLDADGLRQALAAATPARLPEWRA